MTTRDDLFARLDQLIEDIREGKPLDTPDDIRELVEQVAKQSRTDKPTKEQIRVLTQWILYGPGGS